MAEVVPRLLTWNRLDSASSSISRLSSIHLRLLSNDGKQSLYTASFSRGITCKAIELEPASSAAPAAAAAPMRSSRYEIENLTTWLLKQEQVGHIDNELAIVLSSTSFACKKIAYLLQRSNIINLTGAQGTMNVHGEDKKKLVVIANELFCSSLISSGWRRVIASEEEDALAAVEETYSGNYIVVFDPIDGFANIDTSLTTGSILGIYAPDKQCLFRHTR